MARPALLRLAAAGLRLAAALAAGLALALAVGLLSPSGASADEITASNLRARSEDPTSITFTARVTAPAGLDDVRLVYRVLNPKEGDVGGMGTSSFGPGAENDVTFTLETRMGQRYIPVGSQFRYHWEFTDQDGDTMATAEQEYLFLDGRYPWVSKQDGAVTVYYYGRNEDLADGVLASTGSSIGETELLLQVEVPYPVRVMVWASEDDGDLARRPRGTVFDELVSTGGQRVAPDLLFVFAATSDIVRHEAAHIVTAVAGDGPFSRVPSWLDEGTAVYMQNTQLNYGTAVQFGIAGDRTLRLRNMEAASNNPDQINLFYGQSWSTVEFLIEEFGEQQFAQLFQIIREGARTDDALEQVYGVDQDGLYNLWRQSNGLREIEFAPRTEATTAPQAEGTRAPLAIPTGVSSSGGSGDDDDSDGSAVPTATAGTDGAPSTADAGGDDDGGSNVAAGLLVGLVALLFAGALGAGAFYFARRPG